MTTGDSRIPFLFALFMVVLCAVAAYKAPGGWIQGDGATYGATALALARNHDLVLSDDLRADARTLFHSAPNILLKGKDGRIYSAHFWAYSALAAPVLAANLRLGRDPRDMFFITNFLLVLVTLLAGIRLARGSPDILPVLFLLFSGPLWLYLKWPGPEVLSTCMIFLALAALVTGRYAASSLFLALGGLQNPSINLFQLILILWAAPSWLEMYRAGRGQLFRTLLRVFALPLCITLVPIVWSMRTFGALNPLVPFGAVSFSHVTVEKFWSVFLDLNQGLIIVCPPVSLLFACFVGVCIFRAAKGGGMVRKRDLLLLGILLMAFPLTFQANWNPGEWIYMRYCTWLIVPVLFWCWQELEAIHRPFLPLPAMKTAVLAASFLLGWHYMANANSPMYHNMQHKPWVKAAWCVFPGFYDPVPQVFAERSTGKSGLPPDGDFAAWVSQDGVVGKMMVPALSQISLPEMVARACRDAGFASPLAAPSDLRVGRYWHRANAMNYYYVSGAFLCRPQRKAAAF